jgi:hypothetical protein
LAAAVSAKVAATAVAQVQAAVTAAATDTEVERTAPPCRPIRRQPRNARRRFLAGVGGDVSIPRSNTSPPEPGTPSAALAESRRQHATTHR